MKSEREKKNFGRGGPISREIGRVSSSGSRAVKNAKINSSRMRCAGCEGMIVSSKNQQKERRGKVDEGRSAKPPKT